MKQNEIAVTLYTVRNFCQNEKDLFDSLNKIKKIGYNAIQVSSIGPIDPKNVKKMCDDIGLIIAFNIFIKSFFITYPFLSNQIPIISLLTQVEY